ncbi:MAG TPA: hypothetical protein IAB17_01420, partial [Candidatus Alectryocaccobium stercorigallinarum]|nr:hypothetical protein [Candidatus Alectryocaccobium stercorigallinarum]
MQQLQPVVVNDRFNMSDTDIYIMYGLWPKGASGYALLNDRRLDIKINEWKGFSVVERFELGNESGLEPVSIEVKLPGIIPGSGTFCVCSEVKGKTIHWYKCGVDHLNRRSKNPQTFVEQIKRYSLSEVVVSGWAASDKPVDIKAYAADGSSIAGQIM